LLRSASQIVALTPHGGIRLSHSWVSDAPYSVIAADMHHPWLVAGKYQRGMKAFLIRLWRRPSPRPRAAPEVLELPLLPSARLRIATRVLLAAILLYAVELMLMGHRVAAPLVLLIMAGITARGDIRQPESPRCLVLAADGRLFLCGRERGTAEVQLGSASLRLGPHLLLVLRGHSRTFRLLLGPDNLPPHLLAAFKRRLPETGDAGTALH
jgi:hypothetical protein